MKSYKLSFIYENDLRRIEYQRLVKASSKECASSGFTEQVLVEERSPIRVLDVEDMMPRV